MGGGQLLAHHPLLLQESFWNSRIERWVPSRLIHLHLVLEPSPRSDVQKGKGPREVESFALYRSVFYSLRGKAALRAGSPSRWMGQSKMSFGLRNSQGRAGMVPFRGDHTTPVFAGRSHKATEVTKNPGHE